MKNNVDNFLDVLAGIGIIVVGLIFVIALGAAIRFAVHAAERQPQCVKTTDLGDGILKLQIVDCE